MAIEPPSPIYRYRPECYRVRYHFLSLLRQGEPLLLVPRNRFWRVYRSDQPEQEHFQSAVSRACAFPAGVLAIDVDCLCRTLGVRAGFRISKLPGVLCEHSTSQCSDPAIEYCNIQNGDSVGEDVAGLVDPAVVFLKHSTDAKTCSKNGRLA